MEMQRRLQPAEVILLGSRAAGDHRPDSDVDLMAVALDENGKREADGILRDLLEGKYDVPVVNVTTITREEFRRTAPMAQSQAGQAARHGVTPEGRSLNYVPERKPETGKSARRPFSGSCWRRGRCAPSSHYQKANALPTSRCPPSMASGHWNAPSRDF